MLELGGVGFDQFQPRALGIESGSQACNTGCATMAEDRINNCIDTVHIQGMSNLHRTF